MAHPPLFTPFSLRGVTFKNRVVVSPMWQYAGEGGRPNDWHALNLGCLSDGGAGLVFQEGTTVERRACGTVGDLGIWDDAFVPGLASLVRTMKAHGATPGIQLMHAGRKARQQKPWDGWLALPYDPSIADWDDWDVIGPSAIAAGKGLPIPRAMTTQDIAEVVTAFTAAARRALQAGYEVIELHGAHGYLMHQFLSPASNLRTDAYGGDFENRTRFMCEVVEGVRSVWPDHLPLSMRLSCVDDAGWRIEDSIALVRRLQPLGVDLIDCSSGGIVGAAAPRPHRPTLGFQTPYARQIREATGVATAAVGLIIGANQANAIIAEGTADLVLLGREMIYNPNWPIDAAHKLGVEPPFGIASQRANFWLSKRAAHTPGLLPSTYSRSDV